MERRKAGNIFRRPFLARSLSYGESTKMSEEWQ